MKQYLVPNATWTLAGSYNLFSGPFAGPAFTHWKQTVTGTQLGSLIAKMVTGATADFETNWAAFMKYNNDAGLKEATDEYIANLKANWDKVTGPVVK